MKKYMGGNNLNIEKYVGGNDLTIEDLLDVAMCGSQASKAIAIVLLDEIFEGKVIEFLRKIVEGEIRC
ncbi:hypothetical protein Asulf_01594 [Archaeoglobus sulfaticallidus PM70-1]|uniref:Uncharacterized protein n=2 Tax=Archaeoglobus TaxID=2233 RepID=N0BMT5_9EURY|nr:hypothetical protein Asulf_01594 [Archaeoglobus sulfaticallidus PM70-1]